MFGFGEKTGIDLLGERSGLLPSREWKKRVHRKIWYPGETLIAGIGQGYMLSTPIQLAAATATLANRGVRVKPHLLKEVHSPSEGSIEVKQPDRTQFELRYPRHWDVMQDAMERVLRGTWGTARLTGYGLKYRMAGKTGTAQVFGIAQDEEYDEETVAKNFVITRCLLPMHLPRHQSLPSRWWQRMVNTAVAWRR